MNVSRRIFGVVSSFFHTNSVHIWNAQKWCLFVKTQLLGVGYHPDLDPHRFPLWNSMKSHWKYNENNIKYHYGQLILPSISRAWLPFNFQKSFTSIYDTFPLRFWGKNSTLWQKMIQLKVGVNPLGMEPLRGGFIINSPVPTSISL